MAKKSDKPNILVIWGDDIGISNLSCYSHGLMGYKTPNIDRIAKEGMMFIDSYGEQSCTAGRSSFITGQSVLRTGLSKVGIPGRADRHEREDHHDRRRAEEPGLRHRAVRQEPSRRSQPHAADQSRLRRVLRQSLSPECRGRAGDVRLFSGEGLSELRQEHSSRAASSTPGRPTRTIRPDGPRWGKVGKQKIEDTGPLNTQAHGDLRRRVRRGGQGFHQAREADGKPWFVWLNTTHMHLVTHTKKESLRPGRPLAVALSRHHDRSRQECRRDARLPRRTRHRRRYVRAVFDRQRAAPQLMAGRRHDAVPLREEHQLGRRVPHPDDGALARQDQAGAGLDRDRAASRLVPDLPRDGGRARHRREAARRATRRSAAPTRTTSTATTCCPT